MVSVWILIEIIGAVFSQIFKRWDQERTGRAALSPAVFSVPRRVGGLTDTSNLRYVKAELPLTSSHRPARSRWIE